MKSKHFYFTPLEIRDIRRALSSHGFLSLTGFTFFCILLTAILICPLLAEEKKQPAPAQKENPISKSASTQADYHTQQGKIFYSKGDYDKAIAEFEQSLDLDPNNSLATDYLILANQAKLKKEIQERLKLKQQEAATPIQPEPPASATSTEETETARAQEPLLAKQGRVGVQLVQSPQKKKATTQSRLIEYIISEGDTIDISVWEWPNLKTEAIVRPDGKISFPMIGDIHASGLTLTELDEEITNQLTEYIRSPEVMVVFRSSGGKKVILLGEVSGPGVYKVTGRCTILEAIASAGGFTNDAVSRNVIVIRGGPDNPKPISVNLSKTIKKGDLSQDITLEAEDIVYVPKTIIANVQYFVNQFTGPLNQSIFTKKTVREWWRRDTTQ